MNSSVSNDVPFICSWQFGPSGESTKALGINYLALNDLFQLSNRRKDVVKYDIHVQMVEIYNEQVRDLLAQDSSTTKYPFILAVLPLCPEYSRLYLHFPYFGILDNQQIRNS